jgi:(p)ppGpp synthase/HD superfamily hydrolase
VSVVADKVIILTDRFMRATDYAVAIHATQFRKGTAVPYIAHLLGVASLVLEAGGDEDLAIAGLLHDAVEDCGGLPRLEDVKQRFGLRVAEVVLGCSDSTDSDAKQGQDYGERKQNYLDHLRSATADTLLVSLADKVHNARSIVTDIERHGVEVLAKFNGTPDQVLQYYAACLEIGMNANAPGALTTPLANSVNDISRSLRADNDS